MRDILKTVATKVLLNSGEPADLTIFALPPSAPPAPAAPRRAVPNESERSPN